MKSPIRSIALVAMVIFLSWNCNTARAMNMKNMLMGNTLESFLSDLVSFGDITPKQKMEILSFARAKAEGEDIAKGDTKEETKESHHLFEGHTSKEEPTKSDHTIVGYRDTYIDEESKIGLRAYLLDEISNGRMSEDTAEIIASTLSLGALFPPPQEMAAFLALDGPAVADYTGNGNMERLGRSNVLASETYDRSFYNGIWGYHTGNREYALQCHGAGFNIIDVTDPGQTFRVQFVPMEGGGYWRDVATHYDSGSDTTFAYVGAQGTQGGGSNPNLFVFNLSHLSGDAPHPVDSNPIPPGVNGYLNLGETDNTHTLNVDRGLLFLNTARSSSGCRVFDLTQNPMSPQFLFSTAGSGRDCHDSSVIIGVNGLDILITSDGGGRRQRLWDITNVDASWPRGLVPPIIGETNRISGIYAHSNWVTEDNRYLFSWDENNVIDTSVHDISDPTNPIEITLFQYSENDQANALPHNGQIRGNYLYVAYYEAGLRVFDISNPYVPREVGKIETHRDPDGDGQFENGIARTYRGAWNTYPFLPSRNILVSDMYGGLFIVNATSPYSEPSAPIIRDHYRNGLDQVVIEWMSDDIVRGYSIERSSSADGPYVLIAEHLTATTFTDTSLAGQSAYYKLNAINGEGVGTSIIAALLDTSSPTSSPIMSPTSPPTTRPTTSPASPTDNPTSPPTNLPTVSPTDTPTNSPTKRPTLSPTTSPTPSPVSPTISPTQSPTLPPTTPPTDAPSSSPVESTLSPTTKPTVTPTTSPTGSPVVATPSPTISPTVSPTASPTTAPTPFPTDAPARSCLASGDSCSKKNGDICCSGRCRKKKCS